MAYACFAWVQQPFTHCWTYFFLSLQSAGAIGWYATVSGCVHALTPRAPRCAAELRPCAAASMHAVSTHARRPSTPRLERSANDVMRTCVRACVLACVLA